MKTVIKKPWGSYEILNFPTDSRALAISNAASSYDHHILRNNPATISNDFSNFSYSYFRFFLCRHRYIIWNSIIEDQGFLSRSRNSCSPVFL